MKIDFGTKEIDRQALEETMGVKLNELGIAFALFVMSNTDLPHKDFITLWKSALSRQMRTTIAVDGLVEKHNKDWKDLTLEEMDKEARELQKKDFYE